MVKQGLSLKLEKEKLDELKKIAAAQNKTMTEVLVEGVFAAKAQFMLQAQVQELKQHMQELQERYEKDTGKKVKIARRISIPLTEQEFNALSDLAHAKKISKAKLMRHVLIEKDLPALT